jgi:hypothetical protein
LQWFFSGSYDEHFTKYLPGSSAPNAGRKEIWLPHVLSSRSPPLSLMLPLKVVLPFNPLVIRQQLMQIHVTSAAQQYCLLGSFSMTLSSHHTGNMIALHQVVLSSPTCPWCFASRFQC